MLLKVDPSGEEVARLGTGNTPGRVGVFGNGSRGAHRLCLSCDVSLVPQLILPLEVWLLNFDRTDEGEFRVKTDPEYWRVVHGGEVHVHLLVVHQRDLLLLVPPALAVAGDVMLAVHMFHLKSNVSSHECQSCLT